MRSSSGKIRRQWTPRQQLAIVAWAWLAAAALALWLYPGADIGAALICATIAFVARIVLDAQQ